jgi:predicted unusual protein kinase regulating ubiquinone biosynthesis (AarF/ABC1/UbiB family)
MSRDDASAGPVSRGRRFLKLAGMTAAVATNYAANQLKTAIGASDEDARRLLHRVNGERIAQTLGELKGAAMKIGQMASIGSDVLPKELSDALTKLQREAPPMSFDVIAGQIQREFGASPAELFSSFETTPFASASIGQVHRAVTDDGREVVVKVQYPGVDDSVDSDLSHLRMALFASGMLDRSHRAGLNRVFDEVRARLHEELDYCNEADNVRRFRAFHQRHPFVVVPDVVGERSSKRVLTLTYEASDALVELGARGYAQDVRDRIGQRLFVVLCSQLFELKALHSDPNPANYGFRPDGKVVLYDFGCVKDVRPDIGVAYRDLVIASLNEDYEAVERGMILVGARNPSGPPVELEYYKIWRDILLEPVLSEGPYDFAASGLHEKVLAQKFGVLKRLASFQPPSELVFIDRAIVGTFGNTRRIGSRFAPGPILQRYLDGDFEGGASLAV